MLHNSGATRDEQIRRNVESLAEPSNHIHAQLSFTTHNLTDTARRAEQRHELAT
jgi:hypothetical protein